MNLSLSGSNKTSRSKNPSINLKEQVARNRVYLPKWLIGISGGSWFTAVYTYADENIPDETLLGGEFIKPAQLTRQGNFTHNFLMSARFTALVRYNNTQNYSPGL